MVKLTTMDEIDEKDHRMVVFDSDGSINRNLPKELKVRLETLMGKEKEDLVNQLVEEGYSLQKDVGVPQGAATSCSLSILNVRELFE